MADPTREELKEYLQEAGLYEDNLSHSELLNYYNVIKNSESTAQQEQERRDINDSVETIADDNVKAVDLDTSSDIHLDDDIDDSVSDDNSCKSSVGTSTKTNKKLVALKNKTNLSLAKSDEPLIPQLKTDLNKENDVDSDLLNPNDKHKPLDIIFYERKYDLPPYCNPKYSKLTISQRAQIICNFHKGILGKFYELHCNSINPAPWGKPIAANDKFNNFEQKAYDNSFESGHLNEEEHSNNLQIYISRSGRQTKRKVYADDEEDDNDSKKTKKTEDKPYEVEKKSATKRPNINKLNNVDIMKRSKLFADSPRRADKLFDQLKKDEDISITNENIEINSSNDDDDIIPNSQDSDVQPEITFIRRRIIPPRGRRGIGPRKLKGSDTTKSNSNTSPVINNTSTVSNTQSAAASTAENKKTSTAGKTKCPICSEFFSQNDIEAHASSCGLIMEPETTLDTSLRNGNAEKIKCDICDTEMIVNTDYELHVMECIKRSKQSENA